MISTYIRQSQHTLRRWAVDPVVHRLARGAVHLLAGFCLSAASVSQGMLPLVLGLVWACRGWGAVLVATGGALGYGIFWGPGSLQALVWTGLTLVGVLALGDRRISRELPLLIPSIGMLIVSGAGLGFQLLAGDTTPIPLYLIRVALGGTAPWVFGRWRQKKEPVIEWICWGFFTLGLAQIAPIGWLGLGYIAAGIAAVRGAFPCAALTGLALDLAGITSVPMTAVVVLSFFLRFLPRYPTWVGRLGPGCMGILLMYLCKRWDLMILPGLFVGGIVGSFLGQTRKAPLRKGEVGAAQVRLELVAGILAQTRQLLEEIPLRGIDADGIAQRMISEACAGCSARDRCRDARRVCQIPGSVLQKPLLTIEELPVRCKKGSRILAQLRRGQEQLRAIQADRQRQQEYRMAVVQQYGFLESLLCDLSDQLSRRGTHGENRYTPLVSVYGNRSGHLNGDRCVDFPGLQNKYYIILCDGMGSGLGAVQEGKTAVDLLRKMLSCGFPAEHALRSLNSLCALRDRAGAVTVDLAEISLDLGKVTLYKWGAAVSYLLGNGEVEKLGAASVPPGLSVSEKQEVRCSLQLKKGRTLLLVSDGLEESAVMEHCQESVPASVIAQTLLRNRTQEDDATVVTIQLMPVK